MNFKLKIAWWLRSGLLFGKVKHFFEGLGSSTLLFFLNLLCFLGDVGFCLFLTFLEFFYTTKRVNILHFACEERVTLITDLDPNFRHCRASCKCIAANADDFGIVKVLRMNVGFHGFGILADLVF